MKSNNLLISLCILICLVIAMSNAALNMKTGLIEGYYWTQADSVNGQYGSYSHAQRLKLVSLMASNGIGVYWYVPQTVDLMATWTQTQLTQFTEVATLANSLGVRFVFGLRPHYIASNNFSAVKTRLEQIKSAGISYYSLNFDDAEGDSAQQGLQASMATYLMNNVPGMTLAFFTPNAYHMDEYPNRAAWEAALVTVDSGISASVPFVFTGEEITPSYMTTAQYPSLSSNRPKVFWSNWIAMDTSTRIPWGMVAGTAQQAIFNTGFYLNLNFPLERAIHHISCLGALSTGSTTCNINTISTTWSTWLKNNGFFHNGQTIASVATSLYNAIDNDDYYASISALETAYPPLQGIFSQPPTETNDDTGSTSSSSSPTSSSSTSDNGTSSSTTTSQEPTTSSTTSSSSSTTDNTNPTSTGNPASSSSGSGTGTGTNTGTGSLTGDIVDPDPSSASNTLVYGLNLMLLLILVLLI